jgi:hypothetical protein
MAVRSSRMRLVSSSISGSVRAGLAVIRVS